MYKRYKIFSPFSFECALRKKSQTDQAHVQDLLVLRSASSKPL